MGISDELMRCIDSLLLSLLDLVRMKSVYNCQVPSILQMGLLYKLDVVKRMLG